MPEPMEIEADDVSELIAFRIAEQDFCFNIMSVREIRGWCPATVIPHAPEYVRGVINLRGAVVPIVDLAQRLGLTVPEPTSRNVIIIAQIDGRTVGLLVDAVSDILSVSAEEVQSTPDVVSEKGGGSVAGIITRDERMIRMIELAGILPPRENGEI